MKFRTSMICMILLVCGLQLYGQQADSGVNTFQKPDTFTFITIDVPGAGTGPGQGTSPFGITPAGVITGYDLEADNFTRHGFLRAPDGTITTFDPAGSVRTSPFSINPAGAISGTYRDASSLFHGFLRARDGTFTTFDGPGRRINAANINPAGAIAGFYQDASGDNRHGFLRAPDGTITTFDAPGAGTGSGQGTFTCFSTCLNPAGTITGYYIDGATCSTATCALPTARSPRSTFRARAQAPVRARVAPALIRRGRLWGSTLTRAM